MNIANLPVYTVSQVNGYVKELMDGDPLLTGLLVRGEVSNYKCYPSGHHYFSLKDQQGALRCVMFRGEAVRLRFRPANGMRVVAFGRVSAYPRDGQYQLYCSELMEDGRGALDEAFEKLRRRLEAEGLFDQANKQPLPKYPKKIALVTSPAGAAVRDMLRILGARWPLAQVLVVPVRVQGAEAAGEISAAIHRLNNRADIDLIITGRGGGSMEDLWAFNEEIVARAIYSVDTPIISAVGHEPDVTIADFVADLRASTPSNAAELAVPDQNEVYGALLGVGERLERALAVRLTRHRQTLDRLTASRPMAEPAAYFREKRLLLDFQSSRLAHGLRSSAAGQRERLSRLSAALPGSAARAVTQRRERLNALAASLDALSPLKVLGRGYAIARRTDGKAVVSTGDVASGDKLNLTLSDGSVDCRVL